MIELQLPNQAKAPPPRVGRRFTDHSKASPESRIHLAPDHPAILRNGTLFPSSVVSAADAPRVLVSGKNSRKLGETVQKGPWAGFAIYQLTLEERATCPSDCFNRLTCYGNSMPFARRHRVDEALLAAIERDLGIAQRLHPRGFVVRLHVLGDFYSVEYVGAWANFLDQFPALHVFGYTGWSRTHRIGAAILALTEKSWARFAVRFSAASPEPQGATTIWHRPKAAVIAEGIVCPAQTEASACCATCGLCWSAAAKDKTIVFIGTSLSIRSVICSFGLSSLGRPLARFTRSMRPGLISAKGRALAKSSRVHSGLSLRGRLRDFFGIDFCLPFCGFAKADRVDVLSIIGVNKDAERRSDKSERNPAFLSVVKTVIHSRDGGLELKLGNISQIHSVLADVKNKRTTKNRLASVKKGGFEPFSGVAI